MDRSLACALFFLKFRNSLGSLLQFPLHSLLRETWSWTSQHVMINCSQHFKLWVRLAIASKPFFYSIWIYLSLCCFTLECFLARIAIHVTMMGWLWAVEVRVEVDNIWISPQSIHTSLLLLNCKHFAIVANTSFATLALVACLRELGQWAAVMREH